MQKIKLLLLLSVVIGKANSNNLQITNQSTTGNNATNKTVLIKFD